MAAELWMSGRGMAGSWVGQLPESKVRSRTARRGPAWGLRPVCWGSIWYIGRPASAAPAAGEGEAAGTGLAAAGLATAAGDAAGAALGAAPGGGTGAGGAGLGCP